MIVKGSRHSPRHRWQGLGQPHSSTPLRLHDAAAHETEPASGQDPAGVSGHDQGGQVQNGRPRRQGQVFRVHQRDLQQNRMSRLDFNTRRFPF